MVFISVSAHQHRKTGIKVTLNPPDYHHHMAISIPISELSPRPSLLPRTFYHVLWNLQSTLLEIIEDSKVLLWMGYIYLDILDLKLNMEINLLTLK